MIFNFKFTDIIAVLFLKLTLRIKQLKIEELNRSFSSFYKIDFFSL